MKFRSIDSPLNSVGLFPGRFSGKSSARTAAQNKILSGTRTNGRSKGRSKLASSAIIATDILVEGIQNDVAGFDQLPAEKYCGPNWDHIFSRVSDLSVPAATQFSSPFLASLTLAPLSLPMSLDHQRHPPSLPPRRLPFLFLRASCDPLFNVPTQ